MEENQEEIISEDIESSVPDSSSNVTYIENDYDDSNILSAIEDLKITISNQNVYIEQCQEKIKNCELQLQDLNNQIDNIGSSLQVQNSILIAVAAFLLFRFCKDWIISMMRGRDNVR